MSLSMVPSRSSAWPTKSHGPAAMKPVATVASRIVRQQHVAGELLLHEPRVRLVLVERADHVIAIGPGVAPRLVLVVAVRFAVVDHVQPVPPPALAVARRGQQPVHQLLVGVRRAVGDEGLDLFRRRRQAVQVEGEPADQGGRDPPPAKASASFPPASPARRRRSRCAPRASPPWNLRLPQRLERPQRRLSTARRRTLRPNRALRDPAADLRHLRRRKRRTLHRHLRLFAGFSAEIIRTSRLSSGLPGNNRRPVQPALSSIRGRSQRKPAHADRSVMTLQTPLRHNGGALGWFGPPCDHCHSENCEEHLSGRTQHHRN